MRKGIRFMLAILLAALVPVGAMASGAAEGPVVVHEGASVLCIREMMALDTASMTVADFNEAIQALSAAAGMSVFEAISDAYAHYVVFDDGGEYMGTRFTDPALEAFMDTTLSYSAQEIFGEPVHLGSVMRMTMPGMTAPALAEMRDGMTAAEWDGFFEENIAEIRVFPVVTYAIEAVLADPGTLLVAERDGRINEAHARIAALVLGLDEGTAGSAGLTELLAAEFDAISADLSDEKIAMACQLQGVEQDIGQLAGE